MVAQGPGLLRHPLGQLLKKGRVGEDLAMALVNDHLEHPRLVRCAPLHGIAHLPGCLQYALTGPLAHPGPAPQGQRYRCRGDPQPLRHVLCRYRHCAPSFVGCIQDTSFILPACPPAVKRGLVNYLPLVLVNLRTPAPRPLWKMAKGRGSLFSVS